MADDNAMSKSNLFPFDTLIENLRPLSDLSEYHRYLNDWNFVFDELKKHFEKEHIAFIERSKLKDYEYETYQYKQHFSDLNLEYRYSFDIERILAKIKWLRFSFAPMGSLLRNVRYDKIELDNRNPKKSPIVICPFLLPETNYIVIDGNVRLNHRLRKNQFITRVKLHKPRKISDFVYSIDWAMYWFINDVNYIAKFSENNDKFAKLIKQNIIYKNDFLDEFKRVV